MKSVRQERQLRASGVHHERQKNSPTVNPPSENQRLEKLFPEGPLLQTQGNNQLPWSSAKLAPREATFCFRLLTYPRTQSAS